MPPPPLLPVAEAQRRLFALAAPVGSETVALSAAAGRWAAADIVARRTQPHATLSSMDGYALRFEDRHGVLNVIGESAAGRDFAGSVGAGQAVRIFTGAALPAGTDTVMVQEDARVTGTTLTLDGAGPGRSGANARAKGLDFTAGDTLIEQGARLTAARSALAAIGGHAALPVARRIRVAIAATGDELVPPGGDPAKPPEANGVMLAALLAALPVELIDLGILPDRLDVLTEAFAGVSADILVTTGGASVGDHDLVRPALLAAGGNIDFWRVALRPGKPLMAGQLGDAIILGLPGNPVSAFVTAQLFLLPLIAALSGARDPLSRTLPALLGESLPMNDHRADYVRATLRDGRAFPAAVQDSSMLGTLAAADCLIVRPSHAPAVAIGDPVEILPIA